MLAMVSLPLDLRSLHRWAAMRELGLDEGRALHHLLGECFGDGVLRPFRLMVAPRAARGTLYAYTTTELVELVQTAREAGLPDAVEVCDPARLAVKTMPSTWTEGRRLAFDVRTRPVRRLQERAGVFPRGAEVDAHIVDVLRKRRDGPQADSELSRDAVYLGWLGERLGAAATLVQARVVRMERRVVLRGGRRLEGPDVTIHGELVVGDSSAFVARLSSGVGRHTAYGYGMLLLRPAR